MSELNLRVFYIRMRKKAQIFSSWLKVAHMDTKPTNRNRTSMFL